MPRSPQNSKPPLQARSAQEWEALFNSKGVPAGCVLSVPEVLREEQIVGRKFVETLSLENHAGQPLRVTRPGFRLDEDFPTPVPPPILGQNTERWLVELGYGSSEIAALRESGAVAWAGRPTVPESSQTARPQGAGRELEHIALAGSQLADPPSPSRLSASTARYDMIETTPADLIQRATQWWSTAIIDMKPGVIRFRGYPIEQLIGAISFPQMIWLMLRGDLPSPEQGALLEAALVSAVDHGPQAPSIAIGRMAVTCGLPLNGAMASAINVLDDIHGGAGEQCMELYAAIAQRIDGGMALDARSWRRWTRSRPSTAKSFRALVTASTRRIPRSPRLLSLVDAARDRGVIAGPVCGYRPGGRERAAAPQGTQDPDEHRRRDCGDLRRARLLRALGPGPFHPLSLGRNPGARLGAVATGRAHQGADAAQHLIHLHGVFATGAPRSCWARS